MKKIIIGSRGSDLALWQANFVKNELQKLGHSVEIKVISTQGDRIQHLSFDKMEGKGFFTKEIEVALLDKTIDLAVHSHKDLETTSPAGLKIAAVSYREDPSELLLIRNESVDDNEVFGIKKNPIIGTSSARRKAQLITFRDDFKIKDLRGNVGTRINKLREGQYDAIVLAMAGIKRLDLDLSDLTINTLDPTLFIPCPAQGVLGLQIREEDTDLAEILTALNDKEVEERIGIERGVLKKMDGGCQLPLGIFCDEDKTIYVAFAKRWEDGAKFSTFSGVDNDGIIDEILEHIQNQ